MDYIASMSIHCSIAAIISNNSMDNAMESMGNGGIIKSFIKAAGAIIEKIINGVKAVVNAIRNGIKRFRNKSKAEAPIMIQLREFLNHSDELSAMFKKGASIINRAVDNLNKVNITDEDIVRSEEIMREVNAMESDIEAKLRDAERTRPAVSLFLIGEESEKLQSLLNNMIALLEKLTAMKKDLGDIQDKLDKSKDMAQFLKNSSAIMSLRSYITIFATKVVQFNTLLMAVM